MQYVFFHLSHVYYNDIVVYMKCACEHMCTCIDVFNDDDRITLETVISNHPRLAEKLYRGRRDDHGYLERVHKASIHTVNMHTVIMTCDRCWYTNL